MSTRIGDTRCSQVEDADVLLLSTILNLSERAVRKRAADVRGNTLVRNAFEDEWPVDAEALGPLTVAIARRASLGPELAASTGLGVRAVGNRLEKTQGNTLLANAFPEFDEDEDEDDEDDESEDDEEDEGDTGAGAAPTRRAQLQDGRRRFSAVDLLSGIRAISIRNAPPFIAWIASILGMSAASATKRLESVHGRTVVRTVFAGRWPPEDIETVPSEALGAIRSASARRSPSLVRLIADVAKVSPAEALSRLSEAQGNTRVDTVVPELLGVARRRNAKASPANEPPASPRGARVLDGRYVLGRQIGEGGFGAVFEATRVGQPQQRLVIKLEIPDAPESLRDEIGIAFELSHENICSYKDYGRDRALGTYLVLQHGGRSLEKALVTHGAPSVARALDLVRQAAAGLDYAHRRGVIHQDVKPGNILVGDDDSDWDVRVTDFGIAVKGLAGKNTVGKHTVIASQIRGYTRAYAAPEQLRGAKARKGTDQYALALVLCSMLEGRSFSKPYEPRRFARLTARQNDAVAKALSADPDERFESCSEFALALGASRAR
jgi:hypothetical protein